MRRLICTNLQVMETLAIKIGKKIENEHSKYKEENFNGRFCRSPQNFCNAPLLLGYRRYPNIFLHVTEI